MTKGNLTSAVYETGLKYKELNNKPEIQILIEVEEENMVLFFDKEVITMILDNLISNALKYTEKGYIRIRAEWVTENGIRYAQLSVEDTGYGIGQDALAHIFDAIIRRAENISFRNRHRTGTGEKPGEAARRGHSSKEPAGNRHDLLSAPAGRQYLSSSPARRRYTYRQARRKGRRAD